MLEETANDRADANIFGESGNAGAQAAESANDQIDGNSRLRCVDQRIDDVGVFELVHFGDDARRLAGFLMFDLALDQFEQPRAHGRRRNQQRGAAGSVGMAGEIVEEVDGVFGEARVAGQQAEVGVEPGGLDMIVAGADVHVAVQAAGLFADDQGGLGVGLESGDAEGDVSADALEFGGPVQVSFFVEAGLDLHHAGDLLALFGGADQRFHEGRVVADAIGGHLDRNGLRVVGGGADEMLDAGVEALVGMMDEDVSGLDSAEQRRMAIGKRQRL